MAASSIGAKIVTEEEMEGHKEVVASELSMGELDLGMMTTNSLISAEVITLMILTEGLWKEEGNEEVEEGVAMISHRHHHSTACTKQPFTLFGPSAYLSALRGTGTMGLFIYLKSATMRFRH